MSTSTMSNNSTLSNAERWGRTEFGNPENPLKNSFSSIELDLGTAFQEVVAKVAEAIQPFDRLPNSEQNQQARKSLDDLSDVAKEVCGKENVKDKENVENNKFRAETNNSDEAENVVRSFGM